MQNEAVDEGDRGLRNVTYGLLVELGRAPTAREVAAREGVPPEVVEAAWRRLHDGHALVLDPRGEIRMAHPFSAVPTSYRVVADDRTWFANCAWDAFGICAALHTDGDITSSCPDCGEELAVTVQSAAPSDDALVFHCLVPAAHWWDDIVFT